MRKQYQIENLDCAHCAMKMEEAAGKVEGVEFVNVNFLSMKLTLEAEDKSFQKVFHQVERACRSVEPDVIFHENRYRLSGDQKKEIIQIAVATFFFLFAKVLEVVGITEEGTLLSLLTFLPAYLTAGFHALRKAIWGLFHGKFFDENFLMAIATAGAFAIGEAGEGVMVMLLYSIGEFFQELAVSKSRRNVAELMNIRPDGANLLENGNLRRVQPEEVPAGSLIVIKPGEKIPLDGVVTDGTGFLDTGALTGESVPKEVNPGDTVTSGCINMNGVLTVKTQKEFGESTVSKILALIEDSGNGRSNAERFITRFARFYTPTVVILALLLAVVPPLFGGNISTWVHKAVTCLVISCPCALVISVPLSFFGGIGCAGSYGILIKGADCLEKLAKVHTCAFDKTGTLTKGNFQVTAIHPEIISEEALLELATACEHYSDHPISLSLKAAFNGKIDPVRIGKIQERAGFGVEAELDGKTYFVGNEALLEEAGIAILPCSHGHHSGTVVHIAGAKEYLGHIVISDELRDDSNEAIQRLKAHGVKRICLLSGDKENIARDIAQQVGITEVMAELLPEDKLNIVEAYRKDCPEGTVVFVGDGINDTPVLARADLGVAMGSIGADAAIEAADVVLTGDKPSKLAHGITIAKKTLRIVWQNVILSIGIKLFVLIPNIFLGEESIPLFLAIFADVGVCLIAILNATRTLRTKERK
ncbi:MAG: heavy metal translocating P-type ATPase [Clostridia bacterium]|nr:heavy metal translocating P-type ATPase [Clostridia bacterium]